MDNVIFEKYSQTIISFILKLEEGETLYINTESSTMYFARFLAPLVAEHTGKTVNVLLTCEGKPEDVIPFEPKIFFSNEERKSVMLHIKEMDNSFPKEIPSLDDLPAMQRFGHLAEPIVLDRRISLPWTVIPCPASESPKFEDHWKTIKKKIFPEGTELAKQNSLMNLRKNFFNHKEYEEITVLGDNTNLVFRFCPLSHFEYPENTLKDGRKFLSTIDFMKLYRNIDKYSLIGYGRFTAKIFGKKKTVDLKFSQEQTYPISNDPLLKKYFSLDDDELRPGFLTLEDKKSSITLGPGLVESLDSLNQVPKEFSIAVYSLELFFEKNIRILDRDFVIMDKGCFFE